MVEDTAPGEVATLPDALSWDLLWDLLSRERRVMARTHVVLDDAVLEAIDEVAGQRGRSRFLEEAAREKLARVQLESALRSTAGIAGGEEYAVWRDRGAAADWVRAMRRQPAT